MLSNIIAHSKLFHLQSAILKKFQDSIPNDCKTTQKHANDYFVSWAVGHEEFEKSVIVAKLREIYENLKVSKKITPSVHNNNFEINIDSLDTDGDGKINQEEFVIAAIGKETLFNLTMLKAGFNLIAKHPDYFTMDELKAFVPKFKSTDPVWTYVQNLFDVNRDGKIEFSELIQGLRLKYD